MFACQLKLALVERGRGWGWRGLEKGLTQCSVVGRGPETYQNKTKLNIFIHVSHDAVEQKICPSTNFVMDNMLREKLGQYVI